MEEEFLKEFAKSRPDGKLRAVEWIIPAQVALVGEDYHVLFATAFEDTELDELDKDIYVTVLPHLNIPISKTRQQFALSLYDPCILKSIPKHERLSETEAAVIKMKHAPAKLPAIKHTEPVCRFYEARVGDVFKIYRNEGETYWREVVV
jgi:DNA-directed RNA polymerase subunit H (RpoH/RPB5)